MKVLYFVPPLKRGDELVRQGELPFLPHKHLWIDCGDGYYRQVEEVYWHAETERITVHFEEAPETSTQLRRAGWEPYSAKKHGTT